MRWVVDATRGIHHECERSVVLTVSSFEAESSARSVLRSIGYAGCCVGGIALLDEVEG